MIEAKFSGTVADARKLLRGQDVRADVDCYQVRSSDTVVCELPCSAAQAVRALAADARAFPSSYPGKLLRYTNRGCAELSGARRSSRKRHTTIKPTRKRRRR